MCVRRFSSVKFKTVSVHAWVCGYYKNYVCAHLCVCVCVCVCVLEGAGLFKLEVRVMCVAPLIVQELCESRGGRPGLSVLTSLLVSVDVKNY